jgi:hypothetical protein
MNLCLRKVITFGFWVKICHRDIMNDNVMVNSILTRISVLDLTIFNANSEQHHDVRIEVPQLPL